MATISQDKQRGNEARHQRWARIERAAWFAPYGGLHDQDVSQRQAAKVLDVPRSTLQAWRLYQDRLEACPAGVAFFHSVPGLAFLPRLVMALPVVCVEIGACGIRLGCLVWELTGLNRFVGASYGTQPRVNRGVAEAIVAYRREERARLARAMPPKDITLTQDETFTGGLCLGGIEAVSNSIVLEQAAQACEQAPWQERMEQALAGLNCRVMPSTSDEAPGLLAYVEQHLGAPHAPDLCHGPHARSKAVAAPLAVKQRAAAKAVTQAEETLKRVPAALDHANGEPAKRAPGRPPKVAPCLAQGTQAVDASRQEPQRLAGQRATVTQSLRAMGHAYHFVDLERGVRRNGPLMADDIQHHIDTIRTLAQQAHLRETCLERLAKAERWCPQCRPPSRSSRALCGSRCVNSTWRRLSPTPGMPISFPPMTSIG